MTWRASSIIGLGLEATDGSIGTVSDLYFDDDAWTLRYLVVDTGRWLPGRKVLVVPGVTGNPEPERGTVPVRLTREQVRSSPDIDTDRPVSRRQEMELHGYHGWWPYWGTPGSVAVGQPPVYATNPLPPSPEGEEEASHLRSVREVEGYYVGAEDGDIGHVADVFIDEDGWRVRYLGIDTRNWLPGRHVLVAPAWIERIDWIDRRVFVDLTREQIEGSPEYDPAADITRPYEERLHDHFARTPYWRVGQGGA